MGKTYGNLRGRRCKGVKNLWEGIPRTLKNRALSSYRVSRYVRHEDLRKDSRVNGAGHDPSFRKEVMGEQHIAHK